jgi:radical SAM superfamily enzyme YgiQ (UPF0313 family)
MPDETLADARPDAVVCGEGEQRIIECVARRDELRRSPRIITACPIANLDSLPFPARDLVDMSTYSRSLKGERAVCMISSRGCRYACMHCNSVVMGGGSRDTRYRTAGSVVTEMTALREQFRCFRFNDDHFTGNPDLPELLERIQDLDVEFRVFARVEDLTEQTCRQLKSAGCAHVSVGLESLNKANLKAIGKGRQAGHEGNVRIAADNGLCVRASFMVGLPHDSDETIERSFADAGALGLSEFAIYPLIPYPGTKLWRDPGKYGYEITERDFSKYVQLGVGGSTITALRHRNFSQDDVRRWLVRGDAILKESGVGHMRSSAVAA